MRAQAVRTTAGGVRTATISAETWTSARSTVMKVQTALADLLPPRTVSSRVS